MFLEKLLKGKKLHTYAEPRAYGQVSEQMSGYFTQNVLARSMDNSEMVCRFGQGGHTPMSRI